MFDILKEIVIECVSKVYDMRDSCFVNEKQFNFDKYYKDLKDKFLQ